MKSDTVTAGSRAKVNPAAGQSQGKGQRSRGQTDRAQIAGGTVKSISSLWSKMCLLYENTWTSIC